MVTDRFVPRVGLLALQGDFAKHRAAFEALGAVVSEVRIPEELLPLDALVIPGGESTTMTKLLGEELRVGLREFAREKPVWGTCAGMIMLSSSDGDPRVKPLALVELQVARNGFGRQVFSFEAPVDLADDFRDSDRPFNGFFIRAPRVRQAGEDLRQLAWLADEPVALRKDNLLLTSFHPELSGDPRFHEYFLAMISGK